MNLLPLRLHRRRGPFRCHLPRFLLALPLAVVAWIAAVQSGHSQEQSFPARAITIVTPYPGGGLGFDFGHLIADRLEKDFRLPVVVESRPGGNTVIGTTSVVRSAPDGHTLLINTTSVIGAARSIYATPPYDPVTDLVLVATIASVPMVLVVNADLPIHSLPDMVTLAKSRVGGLSFATVGVGSSQHLSMEFVKRTLHVELTHVPYRGVNPGLNDVAGGHVALMFADILSAMPLIQAGKLRAIGVTTAKRAEVLPGVPSLSEIGLPGFDLSLLLALYAPAKTPTSSIAILNAKIHAIGTDPALRKRFSDRGIELIASPGPDELTTILASEIARWRKLVEDAGLARSQ